MREPSCQREQASRLGAAFLLVVGAVAVIGLSLSDRAPHLVVDLAFRLDVADEVERASFGLDPFLFGHAALWGGLAVLVIVGLGSAPISRVAFAVTGLIAAGVLVEEAQRRLTASRGFELQDIAANAIGVLTAWLIAELFLGKRRVPVASA